MMTPRVYISGPITGMPDGNKMAFAKAALEIWTNHQKIAINPHLISVKQHTGKCPPGYAVSDHSSACHLKADIAELMDCDAIYMLKGWEMSRGAQLEHHCAVLFGMEIMYQREDGKW